jgi:hypothetical protein
MYPLPFFAFLAPAFRATGGPNRSSMLLALLILVPGRLGGPVPGCPLALPFDTVRVIGGGAARVGKLPSVCPCGLPDAKADTARCGG